MFYNINKIYYIWIVYSNSGYIPHYGPDSLLISMTTSEMGLYKANRLLLKIVNVIQ